MKINFSKISSLSLKKGIFYLLIIPLVTPFLFSPYLYFPFITLSHSVFRLAINLVLILLVFLAFKERLSFEIFKNSLVKTVLVFLGIAYLASFLGLNFSNSFFSSTERLEGLLGISYFVLFFLILSLVFSKEEIENFLKIQVIVGIIFALVALFIYFSPRIPYGPLKTDRLMGLTGNPSYFGTYLLFNFFFSLYFYFKKYLLEKKFFNFWFFVSLFFLALIIFNATRAVFVGLLFSYFLMTLFLIFKKEKEVQIFKKIFAIGTLLFLLFIALLFLMRNHTFIQNHLFLKRLTTFNLKDPATLSRIISYQIALKIFQQRPILGWGLDSYRYLYPKNFNPKMAQTLPDFMFDRVHNKYLELLIDTGIIGFGSYFLIIYFLFKNLKKLLKNNFLLFLPFLGLYPAYFIQNFFIFDFLESYLLFYLSLAFLVSFLKEKEAIETRQEKAVPQNTNLEEKDFSRVLLKYFLVISIICFSFYSSLKWIILPLKQYSGLMRLTLLYTLSKEKEAFEDIKKIFYYQTPYQVDVFVGFKRVYDVYGKKLSPEEKKKLLTLICEKGEEIFQRKNYDYQFLTAYTDLLIDFTEFDPSKKEILDQVIKEVSKYQIPYSYFLLAKYYLVIEKDFSKGKEFLEKTLESTPYLPNAYYLLFLTEYNLKNIEKANEYLKKAILSGFLPADKEALKYSANLFAKEKDYQTVIRIYSYGIKLYPQEVEFYVRLAAAYGKAKNKEKAIFYAERVKQLDPSLKQAAEEFIDLIKKEQWDKIPD